MKQDYLLNLQKYLILPETLRPYKSRIYGFHPVRNYLGLMFIRSIA